MVEIINVRPLLKQKSPKFLGRFQNLLYFCKIEEESIPKTISSFYNCWIQNVPNALQINHLRLALVFFCVLDR